MPRKRIPKNAPNDYLDGEKLTDNSEPRLTLQDASSQTQAQLSSLSKPISPPHRISRPDEKANQHGKGGRGSYGKGKGKARGSEAKKKKPPLTHFLCLPLVNPSSRDQFTSSLEAFREDVGKEVVPRKAIRPIGTLHLTLGVMSLEDGVGGALDLLSSLDLREMVRQASTSQPVKTPPKDALEEPAPESSMREDPLMIDLTSLTPMHVPHKTSILYAEPIEKENRLYPFARGLRDRFVEEGFLVRDERELKLHATIVNTIYAKAGGRRGRGKERQEDGHREGEGEENTSAPEASTQQLPSSQGHGPQAKSFVEIDATDLISKYRDFVWARNVRIDRVAICKMGAKKILDPSSGEVVGEEYEVVAEKMI